MIETVVLIVFLAIIFISSVMFLNRAHRIAWRDRWAFACVAAGCVWAIGDGRGFILLLGGIAIIFVKNFAVDRRAANAMRDHVERRFGNVS